MSPFKYKNNTLYVEGVSVPLITKEVGTPFYCYSSQKIAENYNEIKNAIRGMDALICYAMKANSNQAVIKTLAKLGAGMDIVSVGELKRAENAKVKHNKIIFSGVGKTKSEIDYAIKKQIFCLNIESKPELEAVSQRAKALNKITPVSIRINPGVNALTHEKISTGKIQDKFGIPYAEAIPMFEYAKTMPNVRVNGVDVHIGSQITKQEPYKKTFERLTQIVSALRQRGFKIQHVDVGGGLGISYENKKSSFGVRQYANLLKKYSKEWGAKVILEPGRYIVANAGILVSQVVYVKHGGAKKMFVIVDAAMNDLLRPTLYNAHHQIIPTKNTRGRKEVVADVVGPVCETGDYLAKKRKLKEVKEGELIAIKDAGAYGAVQSSTYNSRPLVPEVMVKGDKFHVVRPRQTHKQLIGLDSIPNWLK